MKDAIYINKQTAVLNFSTFFPTTSEEFLSSDAFKVIAKHYLTNLQKRDQLSFDWLCENDSIEVFIPKMVRFLKLLLVLDLSEFTQDERRDMHRVGQLVEDFYNYWRNLQRVSTIKLSSNSSGQVSNFIDADTRFNSLIISTYRAFQEKIQGYKNKVYRQLQAGTNASMVLREVKWNITEGYESLKGIPFVDSILLRTPLLLHPEGTKRYGSFVYNSFNPFDQLKLNRHDWFCYPAKVGKLLIFIYVHFDFSFSGITNANLFELASPSEIVNRKPDGIILFGLDDKTEESSYSYDSKNDLWVAKVPYMTKIEYYGYMKKMVLTMHNAIMMKKSWLPIHGSMINIHFKGKEPIGVVFMGDSGAGKSETIEAMQLLNHPELISMDVIFDDMGSFHMEEGKLVAQGTEIGAFIRLDDLDKGSPYKTMDRSIFMNPESVNARVVIPVTPYSMIIENHPVHYFFYANNYVNEIGLKTVEKASELKSVFVEGKRMALATTHEVGLSMTYFANPFGPMQDQSSCDPLIEYYFEQLDNSNVIVGEVYTGLGVKESSEDHLTQTAIVLLDTLLNKN
jgi:hypothetical protein